MKLVVLDPGHGGPDPGAVGVSGLREADANLSISFKAARLLRAYRWSPLVYLTHGGEGCSLSGRCAFANGSNADMFVSIHCNAHTTPNARGFEVWTTPGVTGADQIATSIFNALSTEFPDVPGRSDWADNDPDKETSFYVLGHTAMPAVLVEFGFVTNPDDAAILASDAGLQRCASALALGILQHV